MCGGGLREAYAESRGPRSLPGAELTRGDTTLEPRRGLCHIGTMADPSTYSVIVRARGKGSGYTYLIICTDDPVWSQGTNAFYSSPEAAGEAGRVAMESLMTRLAGERPAPSDQCPGASDQDGPRS